VAVSFVGEKNPEYPEKITDRKQVTDKLKNRSLSR
jgi:hypothetical protein